MISVYENHPGEVTNESKLKMILSQNTAWEISDKDVRSVLKSGEWANKKPYSFLSPAHYSNPLYLKIGAITKVFGPQTGVSFSTSGHTASPVPVFALSPDLSHEQFRSWQHHTDIGQKMQKILQLAD
jgi:alkaline phosphatase